MRARRAHSPSMVTHSTDAEMATVTVGTTAQRQPRVVECDTSYHPPYRASRSIHLCVIHTSLPSRLKRLIHSHLLFQPLARAAPSMADTDGRYVSLEENGATLSKQLSPPPSSSTSASSIGEWLSVHRWKVIAGTVLLVAVIAAVAGLALYMSHHSYGDVVVTSSSSSSSSSGSSSSSSSSSTGSSAVHPACDGLYEWACADWFSRTALPANRTSFSRFSEIDVLNNAVLDDILRSGSTGYPLLDNLFASCMDVERVNQLGLKPLQPFLHQLEQAAQWPDFMRLMGEWRLTFGLSVIVAPSISNSQSRVSLTLTQAPLLLSNRTQYGNSSAVSQLQATIARMLAAAGDSSDDAAQHSQQVIDLEQQLNTAMTNNTQPRQLSSMAELLQYSNVHFDSWLEGSQIPLARVPSSQFSLNFPAAAFFQLLNSSWMNGTGPSAAWTQYARYKLLNAAAPFLSQTLFSAFTYAHFPIRESDPNIVAHASVKVAQEAETLSADDARYLVCRRLANMPDIGSDLLGHAFMDRKFNTTAYAIVESMIEDIRHAWTAWLPSIDWLDAEGRGAFQEKMDNMQAFIGGPPLLASYANVTNSQRDNFFGNAITLRRVHAVDLWDSLLQPFDRIRLWSGAAASTVNAFYYSQFNSFYLFAGFFQAPLFFFDDYVANAPWTGEVIGHEAGHTNK